MTALPLFRICLAAIWLAFVVLPAQAHDGHDDAPAATTGSAAPRFAAMSPDFELVGVLDGQRLALYLDHAADNRPAQNAKVELEIGGNAVAVMPHGDAGEFEATLAQPLPEGDTPVMATVTVGDAVDLLTANFHVESAAHTGETTASPTWRSVVPWVAGGAVLLVLLALFGFGMRSRRTGTQGAAA